MNYLMIFLKKILIYIVSVQQVIKCGFKDGQEALPAVSLFRSSYFVSGQVINGWVLVSVTDSWTTRETGKVSSVPSGEVEATSIERAPLGGTGSGIHIWKSLLSSHSSDQRDSKDCLVEAKDIIIEREHSGGVKHRVSDSITQNYLYNLIYMLMCCCSHHNWTVERRWQLCWALLSHPSTWLVRVKLRSPGASDKTQDPWFVLKDFLPFSLFNFFFLSHITSHQTNCFSFVRHI